MKVCTLNIIPILLAVRNAYSHSLLESTSFQFHSREVLLDDSTTTITTTTINDNQEGRDENSLKFMIQNELDSLRYHTTILSDNLAKQNKIKLQLPSEYLIALKEAFQTSFQNVTFMATELRLLLSESLGRPEESDIITSELNFSSDLFHNVEEKFNYLKESLGDERQRQLMIEESVEKVKGSEKKAKEMVQVALSSLNETKEQAFQRANAHMDVERIKFAESVEEFSARMSLIRLGSFEQEKIKNNKKRPSDFKFDEVLDIKTWTNAGYKYSDMFNWTLVSNRSAVDLLKLLPLKKYRLRNDSKKDVLFVKDSSKDEMRSRTHIGVIDSNVASKVIDASLYHGEFEPTLLHYIHLKALSELASDIDHIHASIEVLNSLTTMKGSKLIDSIDGLMQNVGNASSNFESLSDLAAKVAAAEAELTTKRISSLLQNIKHTLRMQKEDIKLEKLYSVMDANTISSYQQNIDRVHLEKDRQKQSTEREAVMKSIIEVLDLINVLSSSANNTLRETSTLYDSANDDQMSQISLIHADANEERKDEAASLKVIRILGEETRKALLQMIEVVFQHVVDGILHLMTKEEGRHQVLLVIIAASTLVFSISLSKELIGGVFHFVIRTLSMPRLVREWGCASSLFQSTKKLQLSDIVLPKRDKERLVKLCSTINKGKSRRAPLRNVLIHGKTGTGKSLISRAIAESASGVPFAIMSGADIAPLDNLGPSELRNVLTWANRQRHGGIIVIDEAESALGRRIRLQKTSKENSDDNKSLLSARDALNVFLSMTGESGGNIMLILTTSNPSALDEAVLDRCDEIIKCKLPNRLERFGILTNELNKRFKCLSQDIMRKDDSIFAQLKMKRSKPLFFDQSFNAESVLRRLSKDDLTLGFSGRELSKIVRAVETAVYTSGSDVLTVDIWNATVYDICTSIKNKKNIHKADIY